VVGKKDVPTVWTEPSMSQECFSLPFGFQSGFPWGKVVRILQREKETPPTPIALETIVLGTLLSVPLSRVPLHRRESPENVAAHVRNQTQDRVHRGCRAATA
jgi:hypothetical protein